MEYSEQEKKVLAYMFRSFAAALEMLDDNGRIDGEWFDTHDLFNLAEKLNIDY